MSNELAITKDRTALIKVLQTSLYVGAKSESVDMVISYCEAAGFDVMQKPVHIVPINAKNAVSGQYEWRDVVMPGIGLYRIQADRSGNMAGISEPEFGPDVEKAFKDKNGNNVVVTFPEWCKVTARKIVGEHIVEFVAKEYWLENYATDSGKSDAPNTMWRKRPRGQLAKCAEAQALRKGWPEVGAAPTAEEMEGKTMEIEVNPRQNGTSAAQAARPQVVDSPERDSLVGDLEIIAKEEGIDMYAKAWADLTPEQRRMVGVDEHARLKSIAQAIDAEVSHE